MGKGKKGLTRMSRRFFLVLGVALLPYPAVGADWHHWRGPWQNGVSPEVNAASTVMIAVAAVAVLAATLLRGRERD